MNILGYEIEYNDLLGVFSANIKDKNAAYEYVKPNTESFKVEAVVDKNILEIFINDGELYYAAPFDGEKSAKIEAYVKGRGGDRKTLVKKIEVYRLNSIWK